MSHANESAVLTTEEVRLAEDREAEKTTSPEQTDTGEQNKETPQDAQPLSDADGTQETVRRKSQRVRTLSEKGKALLEERMNNLKMHFAKVYTRWKYHIKGLKRSIKDHEATDLIEEVMSAINASQGDADSIYLQMMAISTPEPEIWKMNDTCHALTKIANLNAQHYFGMKDEDIHWPDHKSIFDSVSTVTSANTCKSNTSSRYNKQQAAAEVAASQEVLKIMKTQHQQQEEIQRLEAEDERLKAEREVLEKEMEAENARKRVQFVSDSAAIRMKLEEKRKEVERLEELKRHNAAQARLQVYSDSDHSDEEVLATNPLQSQGQTRAPVSPYLPLTLNPLSQPFHPPQQVQLSQTHSAQQASTTQVHFPHQAKVTTASPPGHPMFTSVSTDRKSVV